MAFVDVRDKHTHKLLFKFDPARQLVSIRRDGVDILVDLDEYRAIPPARVTSNLEKPSSESMMPNPIRVDNPAQSNVPDLRLLDDFLKEQ